MKFTHSTAPRLNRVLRIALVAALVNVNAALAATCPFDTGGSDAVNDGVVLTRYALGITGQPMIASTRYASLDPLQVKNNIECVGCALDMNGDGQIDSVDTTIIARRLAGFTGASLTAGLALGSAPAASRPDLASITSFLANGCGVTGGTITSIVAGTGLTGGTITASGTIAADTAYLQRRVSSACSPGSSIRAIAADGTVTCETPTTGGVGSVTSVIAGTGLTGGTITSSGTIGADTTFLQRRLSAACAAGSFISAVAADGTVSCGTPTATSGGTVTNIATGPGLTGGPITATGTLGLTASQLLPTVACAAGQIPKWSASGWQCAADGAINAFTNGGNAFGGTPLIGTTDGTGLTVQGGSRVLINTGSASTVNTSHLLEPGRSVIAVGGGASVIIDTSNLVPNSASVRNGFSGNLIASDSAGATISGGGSAENNCIDPFTNSSDFNCTNAVTGDFGTIGGGTGNNVYGTSGTWGTVAGGYSNYVATNKYGAIGGGSSNYTTGFAATVPGGLRNAATGFSSFAVGINAKANQDGCAVFGLWTGNTPFTCGGNANTLRIGANKGMTIDFNTQNADGSGTNFIKFGNFVTGQVISAGNGAHLTFGGAWTNGSDRAKKENLKSVNAQSVLQKVLALPVTTWNYISEGSNVRRMGPMAQDFFAAFKLGDNNTTIGTVDTAGVALAAIQGLNQKLVDEVKAKGAEIAALKARLAVIELRLGVK